MACFQAFWWLRGFPALDGLVVSFGQGPILTGIMYIFFLMIANDLANLPFSIYSTFVVEAKYGFNRTTPCTFVKDRLKMFALMLALGVPVLSLVLYFFMNSGADAWFYVWLFISVFQIVLFLIAPVAIMPLFLQMIPLPEGRVIRILDIKGLQKEKESEYAFLKRIFYDKDGGWNNGRAFETKDNQFVGSSKGKKLILGLKDEVWQIFEDNGDEAPTEIYARTLKPEEGKAALAAEESQWRLVTANGDSSKSAPFVDEESFGFDIKMCEVGQLRADLLQLATQLNYVCDKIFLIDGSTRSEHSNAFCTGMGNCKRICLFDSLLGKMDKDEIVAVLGHEIGHDKLHHVKIHILQALVMMFVQFYFLGQFISSPILADVFFMEQANVYVGLLLFSIVWGTLEAFLQIPFTVQSRRHEHQADEYSIDANERYAELLASGLMKLMRNSKSNLTPHPLKVFLDFSHPPLSTRLKHMGEYKKRKWGSDFTQPILNKDD